MEAPPFQLRVEDRGVSPRLCAGIRVSSAGDAHSHERAASSRWLTRLSDRGESSDQIH